MSQILTIGVGQAGIQIADAVLQKFATESGIQMDGFMSQEAMENKEPNGYDIFFREDQAGLFKPRAVLVDAEPDVCEKVMQGEYGNMYDHDQFVMGKESACTFARAENILGKPLRDEAMDKIRLNIEKIDTFHGIMMYNSTGGGTGSGLGNLISDGLSR